MALVRAMGSKPSTLITKSITENGTYSAHSEPGTPDGYSTVTVNVPTIEGVIIGSDIPSDTIGENGDYYYLQSHQSQSCSSGWTYGSSGQSIGGMRFVPESDITITAIKTYNRFSSNINGKVGIYNSLGQPIYESDYISLNSGWNVVLCGTVNLESDQIFYAISQFQSKAMIYSELSGMTFTNIKNVVGIYGSIVNGTIDSHNIYTTDIVIANESLPLYIMKQYQKQNNMWVLLEGPIV